MSGTPVSSGVTSSGVVLSGGGVLNVLPGGTAVSTTVSAGGIVFVSGGGSAISTMVGSRGLDEVLGGGGASATVLNGYGVEKVYGAAVGTVVDYAASQTVFAGGTAVGSLVSGSEIVFSGGITSAAVLTYGTEIVSSGGVASDTVVAYSSGGVFGYGALFVASGGTVAGGVINRDGYAEISRGALATSTTISGGDLVLDGGTANDTTIAAGGTETVETSYVFSTGDYYSGVASATTIAGGTLDLEGGSATGGIQFTGSDPGLLEIGGTVMPAVAISGFAAGDEIDLESLAFTSGGVVSLNSTTDVLTVTEGGSSFALQLAGSDGSAAFSLGPATGAGSVIDVFASGSAIGTSGVPCFAAGTRIATERGEIAVEQLIVGDRLLTLDGEAKPIVWIGSRSVDVSRHPEPQKVQPVLIEAHAFGSGLPQRDLLLSPDHAVYAARVLIPVKHLIDGLIIRQTALLAVTYFHVELNRHAVILAEGLPVESYLDTGDRGAFDNQDAPTLLHPAFASERGDITLAMDALGYAPVLITGPEVNAVKARLAATRYPLPAHRATAARG